MKTMVGHPVSEDKSGGGVDEIPGQKRAWGRGEEWRKGKLWDVKQQQQK